MRRNESLKEALKKIKTTFIDQDTDQITFHRKYLFDFFSADLLNISKTDGLPILKSFVLKYLKDGGIKIYFSANEVQLKFNKLEIKKFEELLDKIDMLIEVAMRLEALTPEEELERYKRIRELKNIRKEIKYPESKNERLKESLEKGKSPLNALVKDLQEKLKKQLSVINNLRSELTNRGQISEKLKIKDKEVENLTSEIIELNQKLEDDYNQGNSITLKLIKDLQKLFNKAKNQIIELKQKLVN